MNGGPETAREMAAAVAAGVVSPGELVERALRRLDEWQPHVNAFSQVYGEEALTAARLAETSVQGGPAQSPLLGVPVAVKDLFDVAGHETTGCSRAFAGNVAQDDAELVRRLRRAGAIVIGKTNQHELACGATNLVSACGPTRNPWDPARLTGGSSGGSGAAVAARVVPLALGSDTGGSIRMPSSLCGCWGLKPTHGRVPTGGMMPLAPSLDCPGPMAVSASDLELWWRAMAFDPSAPVRTSLEVEEATARGRVGIPGDWFAEWSHPETWAAVEATGRTLEGLGLDVLPVDGRGIEDVREVWVDVGWAEFADAYPSLLERQDELLPPTAANLRHGAELSPERREAARRRAGEIAAWFDERLSAVDVLLFPATPIPAPLTDGDRVEVAGGRLLDWRREGGLAWFTEPVNLAGLPALAVPAGRSSEGLPLGAQLVGRRGADEWLIYLGVRLEERDGRFITGTPPVT